MKETSAYLLDSDDPPAGASTLEKEAAELYLPLSQEDALHRPLEFSDWPKPFASFGSFRQRHGDADEDNHTRTMEAPANLGSFASARRGGLSEPPASEWNVRKGNSTDAPVQNSRSIPVPNSSTWKKLSHGRSSLTDLDREKAWERKKAQHFSEEDDEGLDEDEEDDSDEGFYDALSEHESEGICSSDGDEVSVLRDDTKFSVKHIVEDKTPDATVHVEDLSIQDMFGNYGRKLPRKFRSFRKQALPRMSLQPSRTRSLTDEDLEELRGSIDLGFGFSYNEGCTLMNTLPALELYYAINKSYDDAHTRSSPVSPLEGSALLRTSSAGSTSSPSSDNWRISSPGDHPSQVKTRLRHWAQAVACSVKQGY